MSVANTVINYKNSTISNVKDAGLVDLMQNLAENYAQDLKEERDDHLPKSLVTKLEKMGLDDTWEDDEYDEII